MGGPTDVDFFQVWKEKGNVITVEERKSRWIVAAAENDRINVQCLVVAFP